MRNPLTCGGTSKIGGRTQVVELVLAMGQCSEMA